MTRQFRREMRGKNDNISRKNSYCAGPESMCLSRVASLNREEGRFISQLVLTDHEQGAQSHGPPRPATLMINCPRTQK